MGSSPADILIECLPYISPGELAASFAELTKYKNIPAR